MIASSSDSAPGADLLPLREAAARYLSAVAHLSDDARRVELERHLVAWHWKSVHQSTGAWNDGEWAADIRLRSIIGSGPVSAGWRIIAERRFPAALAFEAIHHGRVKTITEALDDAILGEAARVHDIAIMSVENRVKRIWRESKPVLHLALALHAVLLRAQPHRAVDIGDLMDDPRWVQPACKAAAQFLPLLAAPPVRLDPSRAFRVDLIAKF